MSYPRMLITGFPPDWAQGWGQDQLGCFIDYSLPADALLDFDKGVLEEIVKGCAISVGCNLRFRWDSDADVWFVDGLTDNLIKLLRGRLTHVQTDQRRVFFKDR